MTASVPTRTMLTTLDARITQALTALRMARSAGARAEAPGIAAAEERAEADLNSLLAYRFGAQRR